MAPEVVVVGGGITGTGVARDLAMRGLEVTLLERGPIAAGTSGHNHGLLHTGARYADSDEASARDCLAERRIVADIAPHCVEDIGGLFVSLPDDEPGYLDAKRVACERCAIPAKVLDGDEARELEPGLAPDVDGALWVPSATVDPLRLTAATGASAEAEGATVRTGTPVVDVSVEDGRVRGVAVEPADGGPTERLPADHVVNAAGAWAGRVAALAGVDVEVVPVGGALTAVEPRLVDTVIHRGRPRGEGDIAVPHGGTTLLGTTAQPIDDPDDYSADPEAAGFLRAELADLIPGVADAAEVRTFAGLRPLLVDPEAEIDPNAADRDYRVFDHDERDGVSGLTTAVGGKLTTHRLMAEAAADQVASKLGIGAACRTATEPLVGVDDPDALASALERFGVRVRRATAPW